MIKRFGQLAVLKSDKIEEYEQLHLTVWPGVLKILKKCHLQNYSIYRVEDELFAYFEYTGSDYAGDMAKIAADPTTQLWWTYTHPCFLHKKENVFFLDMKEIFHLD
jgi:L-rhamnose mutarotase